MAPRKLALFIALDLAILLVLLLVLTYYGMSHLALLAMGLLFLALTGYDLRSGSLSALFSAFFGFSEPDEVGRLRWLPVVLSALLLFLSLPVLLEHGLVNSAQRWAMQQGQFLRLAIPALIGGAVVIVVAVWTVLAGVSKKDSEN